MHRSSQAEDDPKIPNSRIEEGLQVRRAVLGSEYVDGSMASATAFTRPLQELVSEYCWGAVWSRPGLSRRDRSLLNIGMLAALRQEHELKLHVRGALNNGCTTTEIQEALLQVSVYCGVPAAMSAFKVAQAVIEEMQDGSKASSPNGQGSAPPSPDTEPASLGEES